MERGETVNAMRRPTLMVAATGVLAAAAVGCGSSGTKAASPSPAPTTSSASPSGAPSTVPTTATVAVRSTTLGTVLVDQRGRALYLLTADKPGAPACTGGCLTVWPPLTTSGTPTAGPAVTAHLGLLSRPGGQQQVTAAGWPLYSFSGDRGAGQVHGQGITSFGGTWYAVTANGGPAGATSPPPPSPSRSGTGGSSGY